MSNWTAIAFAFFSLAFSGAGLVMIRWCARRLIESLEARTWPQVKGRILSVERQVSSDDDTTNHEIRVRYDYQAEGQTHEGTRISDFYYSSSELDVQHQLKQKLAKAKRVIVYYKPGQPERAMLAPGFYRESVYGIGFGLLAFGVGLMAMFLLGSSVFESSYFQAITVLRH